VSKEHGMIQGLNFGEFPDGQMEIYTLAGQEKAEIGIGNMKFTEAFSMVPGDEIHVHGHAYVFNNSFDGKYIYDVLEKTFNSDNTEVYLSLKRCAYEIEVENEVVTERSFNDTIALVFNSFNPDEDPCFRFPPEYPDIPFGQDPRTYCRQYYSTIIGGRMVKSFGELYGPVDDLWSQYIDAECGDYYIEGLGQFYSFISPGGESYTEPVYYKQGNEEWGTPYACNDLLAVNEWQESGIEISPNPFWNNISIVLPFEKGHFRLYNSMGSLLVSSPLQSNKEEMDLHSLQKGIYFYSICYEQLSFSGKLIKLN
jgi:hypothetical protein